MQNTIHMISSDGYNSPENFSVEEIKLNEIIIFL